VLGSQITVTCKLLSRRTSLDAAKSIQLERRALVSRNRNGPCTDTTRSVFEGRWLRTGDTYLADADGYYTCLGRTNDMLKAGGIWVSPTEVEARLLEHPDVLLAAVVGLPDADGLDKPVACVVPNEGSTVTPGELIEFCRAGLASFKRPREVLIVDKLPTTATGKLQRFAVREFAASLLRAQQ